MATLRSKRGRNSSERHSFAVTDEELAIVARPAFVPAPWPIRSGKGERLTRRLFEFCISIFGKTRPHSRRAKLAGNATRC